MAQLQPQMAAEIHSCSPNLKPMTQPVLSSKVRPLKAGKKKIFKPRKTLHHLTVHQTSTEPSPVLNFHGLMCVNEEAMKDGHIGGSHLSSLFAHQQVRSVETTDKYIVMHLSTPNGAPASLSRTIERYSQSQDSRLQHLGKILINLEEIISSVPVPSIAFAASAFWRHLDVLGDCAFLCKPPEPLLVISRSLVELWGYSCEQFVLQCLNFRQPLFDGFTNCAYQAVIKKQAENLLNAARKTFSEEQWPQPQTSMVYRDYLTTKQNDSLLCRMKLSMPAPLVQLIQVDKILESLPIFKKELSVWSNLQVKTYCNSIRLNSYKALHKITPLPQNYNPRHLRNVANYLQKGNGETDGSEKQECGSSNGSV